MKLKRLPPSSASSRQMPPVTPPAQRMLFWSFFFSMFPSIISLMARKPRSGIATSATIRMEETALNLLYIGNMLKNSLVSPMKLCPQASSMEKTVPIRSPHLCGPGTMMHPSRNRKHTMAPIYTFPAVNGCSPQYIGTASQKSAALEEDTPLATIVLYKSESLPTLTVLAPPIAPGIRNERVSSMP